MTKHRYRKAVWLSQTTEDPVALQKLTKTQTKQIFFPHLHPPTPHNPQIIFFFFFKVIRGTNRKQEGMSEVSPAERTLWPWWVIFPPFRWWRWGPSGQFSRESGIFSAQWLWEGSALPEKEGRKSVNNSRQSQEGRRDGFLLQSSGFSSNLWCTGSRLEQGTLSLVLGFLFCKRRPGWAGWQGGEGQDDLQSLT